MSDEKPWENRNEYSDFDEEQCQGYVFSLYSNRAGFISCDSFLERYLLIHNPKYFNFDAAFDILKVNEKGLLDYGDYLRIHEISEELRLKDSCQKNSLLTDELPSYIDESILCHATLNHCEKDLRVVLNLFPLIDNALVFYLHQHRAEQIDITNAVEHVSHLVDMSASQLAIVQTILENVHQTHANGIFYIRDSAFSTSPITLPNENQVPYLSNGEMIMSSIHSGLLPASIAYFKNRGQFSLMCWCGPMIGFFAYSLTVRELALRSVTWSSFSSSLLSMMGLTSEAIKPPNNGVIYPNVTPFQASLAGGFAGMVQSPFRLRITAPRGKIGEPEIIIRRGDYIRTILHDAPFGAIFFGTYTLVKPTISRLWNPPKAYSKSDTPYHYPLRTCVASGLIAGTVTSLMTAPLAKTFHLPSLGRRVAFLGCLSGLTMSFYDYTTHHMSFSQHFASLEGIFRNPNMAAAHQKITKDFLYIARRLHINSKFETENKQ